MSSVALTDVGRQREANEDTVATESFGQHDLLIVADGMGGHTAGEVASQCATDSIIDYVRTALDEQRTDYEVILEEAITEANQAIHARAEEDPSLSGMGTTAVVALCTNDKAIIANVGDSRGYHIGAEIEQVTVDQSLVQTLVEQGEITEEEAADHPQRNVVSQSLGNSSEVEPDLYRVQVQGTVLLCSDGLTEEVPDDQIEEIASDSSTLETAGNTLIQTANENGGSDNISVVLYE